jgi:GAF domain-containing protein
MRGFFSNLFRLRWTYTNPLDQVQARGVRLIAWGLAIIAFMSMILQVFLGAENIARDVLFIAGFPVTIGAGVYIGLYLVVIALSATALVSINQGDLGNGRTFFVLSMAVFTIGFYILNGVFSPQVAGLILTIVVAGTLLERRGFILMVGFCVAVFLVLVLLTQFNFITFTRASRQDYTDLIAFGLVTFLLSAVLVSVFAGNQRALLQNNISITNDLRNLTSMSELLSSDLPLEQRLGRAVDSIRDQLGFYHVQLFLVEEKSGLLNLIAGGNLTRGESLQRRLSQNDTSQIAACARDGKTRRIATNDAPALQSEFLPSTQSELIVPLLQGTEVLGVLDVQSVRTDALQVWDVQALEAVADQLANFIHNRRQNLALQEAEKTKQDLQKQIDDRQRTIDKLYQETSGRGWLYFLESRHSRGMQYEWRDGNVVPTNNKALLPLPADTLSPHVQVVGGDLMLIVPITSRGQVLGVMEFRAEPGKTWEPHSIELARAIAGRLALNLDNLRLFEQAQMAVARQQMANQVADVLQAKSEIDSVVDTAVEAFRQALGASYANVRLGTIDQVFSKATPVLPPERMLNAHEQPRS